MIIKQKDSREEDLQELNRLLELKNLTKSQKEAIKKEIYNIKSGETGEKDSAYYIDLYYSSSKYSITIHDLRIEHNGYTAQIDHLIINRVFDIYMLESKNFNNKVRINDNGEFEVYVNNRYIGIPSPIEQNNRHIKILLDFLKENNLLPKRLGITVTPKFYNYVLFSPKTVIQRPNKSKFDTSHVIKADYIHKAITDSANEISISDFPTTLLNFNGYDSLEKFGKKLIEFHKPLKVDWKKRFNISEDSSSKTIENTNINNKKNLKPNKEKPKYFCAKCKKGISEKEARFCWNNKQRFGGKAYCYNCQRSVS